MPMHRWIARAAGGTSQRLKPGWAMILSLSKIPPAGAPDNVSLAADISLLLLPGFPAAVLLVTRLKVPD